MRTVSPSADVSLDAAALLRHARGLLIFDGLLKTPPLHQLTGLLAALASQLPADCSRLTAHAAHDDVVAAYGSLFRALAPEAELSGAREPLRAAVVDALLLDENVLSRRAERTRQTERAVQTEPDKGIPAALLAATHADLRSLQVLAGVGPSLSVAVAQVAALPQPLPWWDVSPPAAASREQGIATGAEIAPMSLRAGCPLAARLEAAPDWGALADELVEYYRTYGSGLFARYRAFRWVGATGGSTDHRLHVAEAISRDLSPGAPETRGARGQLVPVSMPDAVQPGDLIGYEPERSLLRRNTMQFLAGYPANNVLLYGDRGTGKSSSVKALLNAAPERPPQPERNAGSAAERAVDWSALRLIEVPKGSLADFPVIASLLRGRPQRFILFVDDLSFEEGETQYKDVKAMLEGGLEARPENVLVYATSNRRHLVREMFADRTNPTSDEVHAQDTVQEKLSFSDRFGLTITFPTPDQTSYLNIVAGLARRRGLQVEPAVLRARAIEWAAWHNARSGRTARQFVDYLAGELGLAAAE